jgi:hypothetical protein
MGTQLRQSSDPVADETLPQRHCGRCQGSFEGDPTLFFQTDWTLCPPCREILLGRAAASASQRT